MVTVKIMSGQTLGQALKEQGCEVERPCGGNGLCKGCQVYVDGIGMVKSCQFAEEGSYLVEIPKKHLFDAVGEMLGAGMESGNLDKDADKDADLDRDTRIYAVQRKDWDANPVAAVDIGTTTVVLKLFYRGRRYETGFVNPQRLFGADVMSRIQAANGGTLEDMQTILRGKLYQELRGLVLRCKADTAINHCENKTDTMDECPKDVCASQLDEIIIIISANTTMQHIYRGLSCEGLGKAPFSPVTLDLEKTVKRCCEFRKTNLIESGEERMMVEEIFLPGISAFVGADIVSGIYGLDMLEEEKPVLLLDLGTNGEMALGCKKKLLVASAAAGPAFEGSELAMHIHASGIMRVLHELIVCKNIDNYGTLVDKYFENGYPVDMCGDEIAETKISEAGRDETESFEAGSSDTKEKLWITQEDIREIQMAKGAIRAGIEMLLGAYGIAPEEVEKVYLAGGMGYYINPEDAVAIGLLPDAFLQKNTIQAVGNTSLQGAVRFLQEGEAAAAQKLQKITDLAKEIVLANTTRFHSLYMKYMNFEEES